jgi:hypothetical protein
MALDTALYFVTRDIALRSGLIQSRYRIADGRFVLDNKDLSRVRFTTDEYISGLQGVEKTDEQTAQTLIAQNGYQMGDLPQQSVRTQQPSHEYLDELGLNGNEQPQTDEPVVVNEPVEVVDDEEQHDDSEPTGDEPEEESGEQENDEDEPKEEEE